MKFSALTTAALLTATLTIRPSFSQTPVKTDTGRPSFSQADVKPDLNVQLKLALCSQNWGQAIQVIDRMKAASPEQTAQLTLYRGQLQNLLRSGSKVPNWPSASECAAAKVAGTTPASPTTQVTGTAPARRATPVSPTNNTGKVTGKTPARPTTGTSTAPAGVRSTLQRK